MPRNARVHQPDGVFHLISRGVEQRIIFTADEDRHFFIALLRDSLRMFGVRLFAYCLMGNHFHLLVSPSAVPLGFPMHALLTRYALYFNRRYERVGHLFENRFKSIPCLDLGYLIQLVAYIHLNPVRAGMVDNPGAWPWSSHGEFIGGKDNLIDLSSLSDVAGIKPEELRTHYCERIEDERKNARGASRELGAMIEKAARLVGLSAAELVGGGRGEGYTKARELLVDWAAESGHTFSELARALNCSQSALSQIRQRRRAQYSR